MKTRRLLFTCIFIISTVFSALGESKKVAILETVDREGSISYGIRLMIRSELTSAITKTAGYEGYSRTDIDKVMAEHDFQRTGMVNDEQIKQLGIMSGAQYILIAEAAKIDENNMFITASIINVESAKLEKSATGQTGINAAQLKKSCEILARDLFAPTEAEKIPETKPQEANNSAPKRKLTPDEMYEKGYNLFVQRNYNKAIILLTKAANAGHIDALYQLGICHKNGLGTCKDTDMAIQCFEKAGKQGHKEAKKMAKKMKFERFAELSAKAENNDMYHNQQQHNNGASFNFNFGR